MWGRAALLVGLALLEAQCDLREEFGVGRFGQCRLCGFGPVEEGFDGGQCRGWDFVGFPADQGSFADFEDRGGLFAR